MKVLNKCLNYLKENNSNFYFLLILTIVITLIRNILEYYGSNKVYFGLTMAYLLNTYTYVLLMVFAEGYILNWLLKGNKKQLRKLIQKGIILLLVLFIIIPLFNILFNYNFLHLPVFYNFNYLMYPHYGPVGIHIAFILVLFYFPYWLKNIYQFNYWHIFKRTFLLYAVHYLLYYQITIYFSFILIRTWGINNSWNINIWSMTFLIPVIILFPLFIKKYKKIKKEERKMTLFFYFQWIILISLLLLGIY